MRLLYLSCHSILESDDITIFQELGYRVFSPGAYWIPSQGGGGMRPPKPELQYDSDLVDIWNKIGTQYPGEDAKLHLTKEIVDRFDAIYVMHSPDFVIRNWDIIKHKPVIWRTIGQSVASTEATMATYRRQGMKIVRYSPMEANIPGFIGQDGLIRFYKDQNEYCNWNGESLNIINMTQHMRLRDTACNFTFFEDVTRPFNRKLIGPGSETESFGTGKLEFDDMKTELRNNRIYFYTGTHPASYTLNFIEALMTGIPMVCIGPKHGNAHYFHEHNLYEIPQLIKHGENGFVSDDKNELQSIIKDLLENDSLANYISRNGRQLAIKHFNKDMIKFAWKDFLERKI